MAISNLFSIDGLIDFGYAYNKMKRNVGDRKIHIHFVCRGNTFRSRLAAAYLHNIAPKNWVISSSGIDPHEDVTSVKRYTAAVAKKHQLSYQINTAKHPTTQAKLDESSIVVFLSKTVYDQACLMFDVSGRKAIVWNIRDVNHYLMDLHSASDNNKSAEKIYQHITQACQNLSDLLRWSWVDLFDRNNKQLAASLPYPLVVDREYWHRGVHVVLMTKTGDFVTTLRASTLSSSPDRVEIGVGGAVDAGETPLQAAVREIREEVGATIHPKDLTRLSIERLVQYRPSTGRQNRCILYSYVAIIDAERGLSASPEEVSRVAIVSLGAIEHLLKKRWLAGMGALDYPRGYYQRVVDASQKEYVHRKKIAKAVAKKH